MAESNKIQPSAFKKGANPIVEARYQLVLALYLIRKQSRGKYGLFQPDFLCIIFGRYLPHPRIWRTDTDMRGAVREWCADPVAAEIEYGHNSD